MATGIERAIESAGGEQQLADALQVTQQFINKQKKKQWLPLERAKIASSLYGIALIDLVRPDIADAMRSTR